MDRPVRRPSHDEVEVRTKKPIHIRSSGQAGSASAGEVAELVARARGGDSAAFVCLTEGRLAALEGFCRRLMPGAGQDLVQETLLRAYASLDRLNDPANFSAWLFGIAANLARWWWRRQARWPLSLDALTAEFPDVPWQTMSAELAPPDRAAEEADERRRLLDAIAALPKPLARAVILHYLNGLSYAEVAAALQVPVSTVKGRLFKSRAILRRSLDGLHDGTVAAASVDERRTERTRRRKNVMDTITERLVPVVVEDLRVKAEPPTTDSLRRLFEPQGPTIQGVGGVQTESLVVDPTGPNAETATQPDIASIVERLLPTLSKSGLLIRSTERYVVLREEQGDRRLVIAIGAAEGSALALRQRGIAPDRPMTHDVLASLLERGGVQVDRVAVTRLEETTFYATITARLAHGASVDVDARPSDAINLAVRVGAPILVADRLLKTPDEFEGSWHRST